MSRLGVFPGSFSPPTIAHLAIAEHAYRTFELDRVDLAVSKRALSKEHVDHPLFAHRVDVLRRSVADVVGVSVSVTDQQLLADIADGYDILVLGADKWWQINEARWYDSPGDRDRAMASLPETVVFPRHGFEIPGGVNVGLDHPDLHTVSSSRARGGELHLMTPPARAFAQETGAWIDVSRYETWLTSRE